MTAISHGLERARLGSARYRVTPAHRFTGAEHDALYGLLEGGPGVAYTDYSAFLRWVREQVVPNVPAPTRALFRELRARDPEQAPVLYLRNCPIDAEVPILGFDDPLREKHRRKQTFVAEAFLVMCAELLGTCIVGYRTANDGDMFHDIHPMRELAHTPSQKSVDTIRFHADVPNNRVRPDWVYLLSMRNDPVNEVYTEFVRLADVLTALDADVIAALREPIYYAPRETVHVYGGQEDGFTPLMPLLQSRRGRTFLAYFEGNTTSDEPRGRAAMRSLDAALHELADPVFLAQRDFVAISNNAAMHARRVARIRDEDAHRNRWLLKTWNVDDIEAHRANLMPDRLHTSNE